MRPSKRPDAPNTLGNGHARLRSALVVAEIAVALTLLTASGLLLRSFEKMRDVELGFRPANTLAALYVLPRRRYGTQSSIDEFKKTLLNALGQLPGVDAVGITSFLPADGNNWGIAFTIECYVPPKGGRLSEQTSNDIARPFREYCPKGRIVFVTDGSGEKGPAEVDVRIGESSGPEKMIQSMKLKP